MKMSEFYQTSWFEEFRSRLAAEYGSAIVEQLNEHSSNAKVTGLPADQTIPVKDLGNGHTKDSAPEIGSSHIRVTEPDGQYEDFVLGVRRYVHGVSKAKTSGSATLSSDNTWLALSPDRFYLQDGDNGNEMWPVTFSAVSMEDPDKEISVTFDKNGYVSSSLSSGKVSGNSVSSNSEPNLVFVEAIPAVEPNDLEPCEEDPDCDDGGQSGGRANDNTRGDNPRSITTSGTQTYFAVNSIMLATSGDGDGAAELQMFLQESDDYDGLNMPLKYRYRYDVVFRQDPICGGCYRNHRNIEGADKEFYKVPDINQAGTRYYFSDRWEYNSTSGDYELVFDLNFPLIDLTAHAGHWRLLMSDDDKDYPSFSRVQQTSFTPNIDTYDMSNGSYSDIETGFTFEEKSSGSSDDPRWASGVRKITTNNAQDRVQNGDITASTISEGNTFEYVFRLESY
jgi:hypothetical protein